jgi:hypothetical protein
MDRYRKRNTKRSTLQQKLQSEFIKKLMSREEALNIINGIGNRSINIEKRILPPKSLLWRIYIQTSIRKY